MAFFADAAEVNKYVGGAFEAAADDAEIGPKFAAAGLVLRLAYSDPDGALTVSMKEPKMTVHPDDADSPADITLFISSDTLDKFWRGEYNLAAGLARRQVKAKGPVNKILKLVPLTKGVFPMYKAGIAEKDGVAS